MASGPASNRAANNGRRSHSSGSLGGSSGGLSFGASKQAGWLAGHSWLIGRAGWLDRNQRLALGARAAKRLAPNFQIRALASGGRRRANRVDEMTNNPHLHCDRRSPTADNRQQCASRPAGRPARRANESGSLCAVLPAGRPRGGGAASQPEIGRLSGCDFWPPESARSRRFHRLGSAGRLLCGAPKEAARSVGFGAEREGGGTVDGDESPSISATRLGPMAWAGRWPVALVCSICLH